MGKATRERRQRFFRSHPFCCFCGGLTPSTEIDHVPARHMFRGRQWPEGYEFPSCSSCNRGAAIDELLMGFIVRVRINDLSAEEESELEVAITKAHDRHPDFFANMKELSRTETKKFIRSSSLNRQALPPEPYVIEFPAKMIEVAERYGKKLGKALYYLHTGRVIPVVGGVSVTPLSNTQLLSTNFPLERFTVLNRKPILSRSGVSLEEQFTYRYAVVNDGGVAAFLVQFGESSAMLLLAYEDTAEYERARTQNRLKSENPELGPQFSV